jgi:hypothetical protein
MATLPVLDLHGKNTPSSISKESSDLSPDEEKGTLTLPSSPDSSEEDLLAKYVSTY